MPPCAPRSACVTTPQPEVPPTNALIKLGGRRPLASSAPSLYVIDRADGKGES